MNKKKWNGYRLDYNMNVEVDVGTLKVYENDEERTDTSITEFMKIYSMANQNANVTFKYPYINPLSKEIRIDGINKNQATYVYQTYEDFWNDVDNIKAKHGLDWSQITIWLNAGMFKPQAVREGALPTDLLKLPKHLVGGYNPNLSGTVQRAGIFEGMENIKTVNQDIFIGTDSVFESDNQYSMFKTFSGSGLETIPSDFLIRSLYYVYNKPIVLEYTFAVTKIRTIPKNLFQFQKYKKIEPIKLSSIFAQTFNLEEIPVGLFDNMYFNALIDADNYNEAGRLFYYSGITHLHDDLFKNITKETADGLFFINMFEGSNIESLTVKLFENIPYKTTLIGMFKNCEKLTHIPEIWNSEKFTSKNHNIKGMFYGCINADNYNSIPTEYKLQYPWNS